MTFNLREATYSAKRELERRIGGKLPYLLPHSLVRRVLAVAAVATIRPDEVATDIPLVEVLGRWEARQLRGRAARRWGGQLAPEAVRLEFFDGSRPPIRPVRG